MLATPESGWQTAVWQPDLPGRRPVDVPISYFGADDAGLHAYFGLGEEERATEHGVRIIRGMGVAATGIVLPFHDLEPTAADIQRVAEEVPLFFAERSHQLSGREFDQPIDLLGHSQGGAVVLGAARRAHEHFGAIAALAPLGLNGLHFGNHRLGRRARFVWRLGVINNMHPSIWPGVDPVNRAAMKLITDRVIADWRTGRLWPKIDYALSLDEAETVQFLDKEGHPVQIFAGQYDRLFPPHEQRRALGRVGCDHLLQVVPGTPHSPMLNRKGTALLGQAVEWLKDLRAAA